MTIPQSYHDKLQQQHETGLFPLVEVVLEGTISFEKFLSEVYYKFQIPHKVVKADIEYKGGSSFGKLLLYLQGNQEENARMIHFFKQRNIQNSVKGYA
ncbi:NIL domain-containing protein [Fluviicola sp.]|uniref:NIL domain-containing protein n=1 Tax=Fluviicola sp. TaxID=1917219 RepID=UPI0031DB60D0